jgi:hypothetical protein
MRLATCCEGIKESNLSVPSRDLTLKRTERWTWKEKEYVRMLPKPLRKITGSRIWREKIAPVNSRSE